MSSPRPLAAILAVFASLGTVGLLRHEMWRDELEIWLIARDSSGLVDLFANMSTEGHPALWYLMNFVLARLTRDPIAMQLLHLVIAVAAAWVFLRHAPFPRSVRLLFVLGYFPFYEFTVISRAYGLQLLLTFAVCALYTRRHERPLLVGLSIALLAQTNLYGAIVGGSLVLAMLAGRMLDGDRTVVGEQARGSALAGLGIALAGIASAAGHVAWQASRIGPDHLGVYRPAYDPAWLAKTLSTVTFGFLPFPDPTSPSFWNSSFLDLAGAAGPWIGLVLGIVFLTLATLALAPRPAVLLAFTAGTSAMLILVGTLWYGQLRQHGQIFLLFVVCSWIYQLEPRPREEATSPWRRAGARFRTRWIVPLLVVHLAAAAFAWSGVLLRPFSNASAVGRWLSQPARADTPIVGSVDYTAMPITAFLDRPIFYPESGSFGTFLDWSPARRMVRPDRVLAAASRIAREEAGEVWIVLSYELRAPPLGDSTSFGRGARLSYVERFDGAIVPDENYHVYRLDPSGER